MSEPTEPPKSGAVPAKSRERLPSWDELSASHTLHSDPPAVAFFDRLVGRAFRRGFVRAARNRWMIAALAHGAGWLFHHLAIHWRP